MMRALLTALAPITPVAGLAKPQSATVPWIDRRPAERGEPRLRATMVVAHNQARRQYGIGPLVWDDRLARDARAYAVHLARTGRFAHDPQVGLRPRQGENLWMGTRTA